MKTKKILSVLISAAMLLSGITAVSAADETSVATVNGGGYSSLQAAFDAVSDGGTIIMQADTDLAATAELAGKKKVTLDMNGKTISFPGEGKRAINVTNGSNLTITGNGEVKAGQVAVQCSGENANNMSTVTIEDGTYNAEYSLFVCSHATVTVNNGTYNGWVYTNGTYENSNLVINNGTFTKQFYLAAGNGSTYVINDGTFTDSKDSTIEIKGGTLTINGGTFTNTSDVQELKYNGNGSSSIGYALAVLAHNNYKGANVTVNGGTFNGPVGLNDVPAGTNVNSTLTIYGGTFTNDISKYKPTVAKIGDTEYKSLQAAFDAVSDGGTIVMQADTNLAATAKLAGKKKVTLDMSGRTIKAGNDGFAIHVTNGANLTIKGNGTINADVATIRCGNTSAEVYTNTSYVTIEDGTYNGTVFASGYGNITIKNGTFGSNSTSNRYAVHTNGANDNYGSNTIVINNGTFNNILYLAGRNSEYTINGGTFTDTTGKSAVEIKGGKMSINGGTFDNTAATTSTDIQGNDNSTSGYALAVVAQDNYQGADVTINGGTFKKAVDRVDLSDNVNSTLSVTGGTYVNEIKDYVAAGLKQITIGEKYGVAENKETKVTVADEEVTKKVKEGLGEKAADGTTEKVDTFSLSELSQAYLVRATYPVSDENGKKADVDVDFDLGTASEIGGSANFGVVFYNIANGITIGAPTISVAK